MKIFMSNNLEDRTYSQDPYHLTKFHFIAVIRSNKTLPSTTTGIPHEL